jgi:vitamin B12 transporter
VVAILSSGLTPGSIRAQDDAFALEGLVVTTSPTARSEDAVSSHVTILSGERLAGLSGRSLGDALRGVPGLDVVRGGSFGAVTSVFLRGGESDHTLVLVDGVQVNQAGGGFDFADLSTDNVERVEIVRGPASALYGSDAVTGVIHIITRTGRGTPRGAVAFRTGSFGRSDWLVDLQAGTERAGYAVTVGQRRSDGILAFNNQTSQTVLSGTARLRPDSVTDIAVTLRYSDREYHFPTDGSGAVVDRNAFTFSDATSGRVGGRRSFWGRLTVEAAVAFSETDGGTDDAPDSPSDTLGFYGFTSLDHFSRTSGELRAHLRVAAATVTTGFEYEQEGQRSFAESRSQLGPSVGKSESRRRNRAYFVHGTGDVGGLSVNGGARLDDNERFGRSVSWQAGATWALSSRTGTLMRANAGRALKEPTFSENFSTGFVTGNPDLDPERSTSWEVGMEQSLIGDRVSAKATYFDQRFEDLIQYTSAPPNPGDPNFYNVAEATARGVELDVGARASFLSGGASWTWLDTKVVDAGFDEGAGATFVEGERLLRRPTHSWSLRIGATFDRFALSSSARFVGDRADRDFSSFPATPVQLDDYAWVTVGASVDVLPPGERWGGITLELEVENLLDQPYEESFGFPGPGRGIYLGGRVALGPR